MNVRYHTVYTVDPIIMFKQYKSLHKIEPATSEFGVRKSIKAADPKG